LLMVLALLLTGLWFAVLRPAVRSAAGDAAARQTAEVARAAQEAKQQAGVAKQEAGQAKQNAERVAEAAGVDLSAPPTSGSVKPGTPGGDPTDFRIAADAPID